MCLQSCTLGSKFMPGRAGVNQSLHQYTACMIAAKLTGGTSLLHKLSVVLLCGRVRSNLCSRMSKFAQDIYVRPERLWKTSKDQVDGRTVRRHIPELISASRLD